jgi:putative copper export protein
VLLIKLALVLLALGAGAFNWRRVRPRFEREDATAMLRRSGGVELALALGILLVTAVLVAVPTPR